MWVNSQHFLVVASTPMLSLMLITALILVLPELTWIQLTIVLLLAVLNGIAMGVAISLTKEQ
jgi:hypothetical protein